MSAMALPGTGQAAGTPPDSPFVRAAGARFIDASGRQILFHGLNIVDKTANWTDYAWVSEADYAAMKDWGFNCIRLGFTWASIEPEPGVYSEKSLAEIGKRVEWAKKHGLYVVLDMHQDLYSMKYSDGAPDWATLTDGKPHIADGKVWSDAYVTSPAVQTAMDNFYANKAAADGVGLQDHYAGAWRHIARHFADNPTVVGYDLMNEPFAGSLVPQGLALNLARLAQELGKTGEDATAETMAQWSQPEGRAGILEKLSDPRMYARVIDSAQPLFQDFERTKLMPFFQLVTNAIRQVDSNHIIFLETGGASNMGVYSAIDPLSTSAGKRDPQQAYAPHGYDLVTDTPDVATASNGRIGLIFKRHDETAHRLDMPMLVGEWGAYYGDGKVLPSAQFICREFEALLCGDTYWSLEKNLSEQAVFQALCRPYPMAVAGTIVAYRTDPEKRSFTCTWEESAAVTGESRFYLPAGIDPSKARIQLTPAGHGWKAEPVREGGQGFYLVVSASGRPGPRRLTLTH